MSVNKAILMGRLGADPKSETTKGGTSVCKFSIATSERYKSGEQYKEDTTWHNIIAFAGLGETIAKHFHKGDQIFIEGRISNRTWDKKDGSGKGYASEVIATSFSFVDAAIQKDVPDAPEEDDDLPF
jgi:single-strand DNA-binding protein